MWFPRIDVLAALGQGLGPLTKGDFNADGKPDLPWQDATTGVVYVWFMRDTSLSSGTYVAQGMEAWKVVGPK